MFAFQSNISFYNAVPFLFTTTSKLSHFPLSLSLPLFLSSSLTQLSTSYPHSLREHSFIVSLSQDRTTQSLKVKYKLSAVTRSCTLAYSNITYMLNDPFILIVSIIDMEFVVEECVQVYNLLATSCPAGGLRLKVG